jgi:hypothetical protein
MDAAATEDVRMAEDAQIDLPAHERAYHRFIRVTRIGAIAVFVIAAIVVLVISR